MAKSVKMPLQVPSSTAAKSTNWTEIQNHVHQIAHAKRIMLSTENVQKVHSRPKLQGFEGKIAAKSAIKP